jgi:3-phosphoshikimate 1-carboxyvinyltransferase
VPESLLIPVVEEPLHGRFRPPGSKSITNRAVLIAALAAGHSRLDGVLDSDDTRVMAAGLTSLGIPLRADWANGRIDVEGCGGRLPAATADLDCHASGTTMRFLTAAAALGPGPYRLDGTPRMRRRPIGDLIEALQQLGLTATAESEGDCPPVTVRGGPPTSAQAPIVHIRSSISSQFASGIAMIGPCLAAGLELAFEGAIVSWPYLEMTDRMMRAFGAKTSLAEGRWRIAGGGYRAVDYMIEPDASAASYFLAMAAITGGSMRIDGLSRASLQGDVGFAEALEAMGCTVSWHDDAVEVAGRASRGIEIDMNAISDTVPTLAVVACFADGPTSIHNVRHIRDKETDRIADLARELGKLGVGVEEHEDGLRIVPAPTKACRLATYDDHRMAMSLSLAGLRTPGVVIEDPGCVAKTFPDYWKAFATVTGKPCEPLSAPRDGTIPTGHD